MKEKEGEQAVRDQMHSVRRSIPDAFKGGTRHSVRHQVADCNGAMDGVDEEDAQEVAGNSISPRANTFSSPEQPVR